MNDHMLNSGARAFTSAPQLRLPNPVRLNVGVEQGDQADQADQEHAVTEREAK